MSRQTDIKALRGLRDTIIETRAMINMSERELAQYEACEKELTGTKFVFKPLPTNNEEAARANFKKAWTDKYSDPDPMKNRVRVIVTILLAIFGVLAIVDLATASGFFFTDVAQVKNINSRFFEGHYWFAYVVQVVFYVAGILFTWCFFSDFLMGGIVGIIITLGVSGLLHGFIASSFGGKTAFWLYVIGIGLSFISGWIVSIVYAVKKKLPHLNAQQKAVVAQEKQKDIENAAKNVDKEKQDKEEWQAWWDVHKYELDEQMDIHMDMAKSALDKAEELQAQVEDSDVLGPNEKDVAIIDWLIYFIEGHRADSIKEALQQYDLMQHNEKMLEIEREKYNLEVARIQKENADRERALEQERYHQMRMEAEARRAADMQAQVAANTAAMRDSAERMRKEAAWNASAAAATQQQIAADVSFQRMQNYYNN